MAWTSGGTEQPGTTTALITRYWTIVGGNIKRFKEVVERTSESWAGMTEGGANTKYAALKSDESYEDIVKEPGEGGGWRVSGVKVVFTITDITAGES